MQGAEAKGKAMHALGWSKNLTEYPTKSLGGILRNVQEDRDVWAKHHIFTKKRKRNAHAFLFLVGKDGFEPPKSKDSRFTVCPIWPLWNLPKHLSSERRCKGTTFFLIYKRYLRYFSNISAKYTIFIAVTAHSSPLFPWIPPARSSACCMVSVVMSPKITGISPCVLSAAIP